MLAEASPERSRNGAGKAAHGEDEAGNEDQVVQLAGQVGDVCRQYGLDDEDDDLDQGGTDQHQADDGNLPEADLFAFCPGCGRIRCGCIRRRFFDEEDQDDEVEEQGAGCQEEGHAHAEGFGQDAAEEGADDAACRQGALHDAQADAQFLRRCIDGHDGQFHRPQARCEALEHAHERQLQRRRDDAAEKIADR